MNKAPYEWNEIKKVRNKRTGRIRYILGSIVGVLGMIRVMDFVEYPYIWHLSSLISGGILVLIGLLILFLTWRKVETWDRYEAFINNRGNTPISYLASALGESEAKVCANLQEMINNHFFMGPESNIEAYIDGPRNLLVMTRGGVPLEPIEETVRQMERAQNAKAAPKRKAPAAGQTQAGAAAGTDSGRELLQSAIATTDDKVVKASLYDLEASISRIEQKLASDPQLADNDRIRNLQKHYLPMTLDLVRKYQAEKNSPETMAKIGEALGICADAFGNVERKLTEKDDLTTEVSIRTLETMFAQDGLLQTALEK